ncbi:hypothetical protein LSTR_LSTR013959 [Laodelphax striatellus]|uniref:Arrestin-like N-terminal domain-containing protein n=1 Tax=Laodelphax striatellus TaxID=195883 RepID=A0A482WSA7_LAOST|nr:hypothetical protein LSTR_LSTR013959 [Laodelphax striatellus]
MPGSVDSGEVVESDEDEVYNMQLERERAAARKSTVQKLTGFILACIVIRILPLIFADFDFDDTTIRHCTTTVCTSSVDTAGRWFGSARAQSIKSSGKCSSKMVFNFKVFKKVSPNGKLTLYLGKRDFVDHISAVEPIDGVALLHDDYVKDRKVFGQVICSFRYGREEDEVMGLNFQKDLYLASEQIYPPKEGKEQNLTKLQERLVKKLGPNAVPFTFNINPSAPASVTLQPGPDDEGHPCGVQYFVKLFTGENETDRTHRR